MAFQKIFEDNQQIRVEIVKGVLGEHDIEAVIMSKKDRNHHFGYYEVHVSQDDVLRAIKIIQEEIKFE
jgi:hypothetical protein